mmetsp:Transcript_32446/g.68221  ORF Transcript_32446/g.68221 Transcript_32446/m.68221 type:complete len:233 (+) Transcript_32446:260-958(+)
MLAMLMLLVPLFPVAFTAELEPKFDDATVGGATAADADSNAAFRPMLPLLPGSDGPSSITGVPALAAYFIGEANDDFGSFGVFSSDVEYTGAFSRRPYGVGVSNFHSFPPALPPSESSRAFSSLANDAAAETIPAMATPGTASSPISSSLSFVMPPKLPGSSSVATALESSSESLPTLNDCFKAAAFFSVAAAFSLAASMSLTGDAGCLVLVASTVVVVPVVGDAVFSATTS